MPTLPQMTPLNGYTSYQGLLAEQYERDDVGWETYARMQRVDPIVKFASRLLNRSVRRRIGEYRHEDERVQTWVRESIMPALTRDWRRVQTAFYFGVSVSQPRWEVADGEVRLKCIDTAHPSRYWNRVPGFHRDPTGEIDYVEMWPQGNVPVYNEAGIRQLAIYSSDDDFGSPWGMPAARQAYTAWYIKNRLSAMEAIGLEKHAMPTVWFGVSDNTADPDTNQTPAEAYIEAWNQAGSVAAIAGDKDDDAELLWQNWTGSGSPFDGVLRRLDGYIFNSFYMPYLLAAEGQFGTRAQATVQVETYLMAETDIAEEQADTVAVDQIIGPAVAWRFGNSAGPGTLPIRDATPPDREAWARILTQLDATGVFNAEADDQLRWACELFELPAEDITALLAHGVTLQPEPPA